MYHLSLSDYKILCLPLTFSSFIMVYLAWISSGLYCLEFTGLLQSLSLCFDEIRKFFSHYFCKYFLLQWTVCYIFLRFHETLYLMELFQRSLKLCSFPFNLFFLFLLGLHNFYWSVFRFTHASLCHLHFDVDPIQWVRYFTNSLWKIVCFSVLKLLCGSFFYFMFLCWYFLLSTYFKSIHLYFLEHLQNSCIKSLWSFQHLCHLGISVYILYFLFE